jgi:hypothetical protein
MNTAYLLAVFMAGVCAGFFAEDRKDPYPILLTLVLVACIYAILEVPK